MEILILQVAGLLLLRVFITWLMVESFNRLILKGIMNSKKIVLCLYSVVVILAVLVTIGEELIYGAT